METESSIINPQFITAIDLGNIEDDQYHDVVLNWDVNSLVFSIYLDNNLIGTVNRDLRNDFTGLVYWGLHLQQELHILHKFKYNPSFCMEE